MISGSLHRAVWRWHFYAGLFCIPSLLLLSGTGAIYLFDTQIEDCLYRDRFFVQPESIPALSADTLLEAALRDAHDEMALNFFPPPAPDRSASVSLLTKEKMIRSVYVDPYTGALLGSVSDRLMETIQRIHTLEIAGKYGNRLVECVAGWAIILFLTGVYLWWPRSLREAMRVHGKPGQRVFWRDVHRIVGITAGGVLALQALTGLPWTSVWGAYVGNAIESRGQGIPPMVRNDRPESTMPSAPGAPDIGLDKALALANAHGMPPGYMMSIPSYPRGVYTAILFEPDDPADQRVIHFDRYTGAVIADIGFEDYGRASRFVEWGRAIHKGNYFGWANRLIWLAMCIGVWVLAGPGVTMWWKRRPKDGGLTAPPAPNRREAITVFVIILAVSLLFPLTALSIILLVVVDRFALAGFVQMK